jgi:outer membrane protein assembly factor BamB
LFYLLLCLAAFGQDAATFRGNLQHTGVYETAGVAKFTKVKWQFPTHGQIISSPAVAEGMVFVGSADHNLYAVDRESGALKWKFETGSRVASSPAVSGGLGYFESYDSNLYEGGGARGELK